MKLIDKKREYGIDEKGNEFITGTVGIFDKVEFYEAMKYLKEFDAIEVPFNRFEFDNRLMYHMNEEHKQSYKEQRYIMEGYTVYLWLENNELHYEW